MQSIRLADERGRADHGWLDTRHTFSFGDYHDPRHMGFRSLRVINDDRIAPGGGFPMHPHRDMEIITYVIEGAVAHHDSMGNETVISRGEIQRMTAGKGVVHSEFNHHDDRPLRLLQIWIVPETRGLEPGYEQKRFTEGERRGRFRLVASPSGENGSITVHQDVRVLATIADPGQAMRYELAPGRHAWLHVATGAIKLGDDVLRDGDAVGISHQDHIEIVGIESAEVLLFDLA